MKVRLDRLGDEPYAWQESLALSSDELDEINGLAVGEVGCSGRLSRTTPGFLLQLDLAYEQTLSCTRCLGPVRTPVRSRIDLHVVVGEGEWEEAARDERQLAEQDLGLLVLPGPLLDTRPIVMEEIQLDVPMKTLCRDDCLGLCVICGADLNAGPCDCRPASDPRWAALAGWKKQDGGA